MSSVFTSLVHVNMFEMSFKLSLSSKILVLLVLFVLAANDRTVIGFGSELVGTYFSTSTRHGLSGRKHSRWVGVGTCWIFAKGFQ